MNTIDWKIAVSRSMEEAIEMFDAVPMRNDATLEYQAASYSIRASLLHTALEQGMKFLYRIKHPQKNHPKTHTLDEVYKSLPQDDQQSLDKAFADAVKFYGFRPWRDDQKHLANLDTYLTTTGQSERFETYRYWAVEEKKSWLSETLSDVIISRELIRFIADQISGFGKAKGGPFTVSQLVEYTITRSLNDRRIQLFPERVQNDYDGWKADDGTLIEWLKHQESFLSAMRYACENQFEILNEQASEVLRNVHEDLTKETDYRVKPALQYALLTFNAMSFDCPVTPPASVEIPDSGRFVRIKTPAGSSLGTAEERYDGLWIARFRDTGWAIAKSQKDAIGLLVTAGTQTISVLVQEKPTQETRMHSPKGEQRLKTSPPRDDEQVFEFWEENLGIAQGDKITILEPAEDKNWAWQTEGTVKSVNGHTVTITEVESIFRHVQVV